MGYSRTLGTSLMLYHLLILTHHECNAQPGLIKLESKSFEGLTQASTGQTTGTWCDLMHGNLEVKSEKLVKTSNACQAGLHDSAESSLVASRFVLFTSSVESSLQALSETWAQLGDVQQGAPILHGLVDIAEDQHLAERFSVTNVPTFLFFRDRKVSTVYAQSTSYCSPVWTGCRAESAASGLVDGRNEPWNLAN